MKNRLSVFLSILIKKILKKEKMIKKENKRNDKDLEKR